ncbi:sigma-54 dependent transcriptional regulator [Hydrogenimonas thermophila]|uniref:sigma-54-dependent transcriptional regulator n=1 Tax=Hydrogenimonas thermophila TaxID=223786 RepID=UPI0029373383|nr:sigma-54 dependent transcriptional regulator [Hydrogenimonas thermophila]WOE70454.1 sigma-54 dependent transcriptional regulator [Hydrogenimonas thermophila]WOE72971.1 sigma-54 dependent transcriptional regulator [Hydrogenimonas thermophila]
MKIAIVEDDINMRKSLEIALGDYDDFEVKTFRNAKEALKKLDESYDLVISDITMPGMNGIEFVEALNGRYDVIIITGNATLGRAIESIRLGVSDFLTKPFEVETLVEAIRRSQKVQARVKKRVKKDVPTNNSMFYGTSEALEKTLNLAYKAAKSDASILLLGESGVGKELFAKTIHNNSPRKDKPFVAINMAAIPENLIESELFGFEKGAFTDAFEAKMGKFEAANGGTLFLDEIAEMPFHLQAKLLRALQEKVIYRLGSTKGVSVDVRIIAATNADIKTKMQNQEFREDLYYRIATIPIHIPPLRERKDEIIPIAQKCLEDIVEKYDFNPKAFSEEAKEKMIEYHWPGNIRELIAVVERAAILSDGDTISENDLFLDARI